MTSLELLVGNLALIAATVSVLWLCSLWLKNASIADIFWGAGFVVITANSYRLASADTLRAVILLVMTSIWGLRLTAYLGWRNWGKPEDYRYAAMREPRQASFWVWSLPCIFWLQGLLIWLVALPVQLGMLSAEPFNWVAAAGLLVWIVGVLFETIGDWQLARFKARSDSQGKVLQTGLWRYTRHPNYFGDFLVWWGIFLVAAGHHGPWWTIVSPLLMTLLLLRVSGVALLEKSIGDRRPEYRDYVSRTSAFFPWPPKR